MKILKALVFLIPLALLFIILFVGFLSNGAIKKGLESFAQKKGLPMQVGELDISLPNGSAIFHDMLFSCPEEGLTARIEKVALTLDHAAALKGRRSITLALTNATIDLQGDLLSYLVGEKKFAPIKEGGALINYSAGKVEASKLPMILSEDESREPLYISALLLQNALVRFRNGENQMLWKLDWLKASNLAVPKVLSENPVLSFSASLPDYPKASFTGEIKDDETEAGVTDLDFEIKNFPAEMAAAMAPQEYVTVECSGGDLFATGHLRFEGEKMLPGTISLQARGLTIKGKGEIKDKKGRGAGIPDLTLNDASLDLKIKVDGKKPYIHLKEAWDQQGGSVQSGKLKMTLDLRLKK